MSESPAQESIAKTLSPSRLTLWVLLTLLVPAVGVRFYYLSNALIEPHPYRQTMTALVTQHFWTHSIDFFFYRSPSEGLFWNVMHEFPIYQWLVVTAMQSGASLETASRLVTLIFFFLGSAVVFAILRDLFDRQVALWGTLSYLISPFNIVFSRTGLIDFTAQFFMLAMIWCSLRAVRRPASSVYVLAAILAGTVAALIKCYLWFIPVVFLFGYCAFQGWKHKNRPARLLVVGLIFQLIVAVSWILWTGHIRGEEWGKLASPLWILGTWEQRLLWRSWVPQFKWIFRWVLHDWMAIPFIIGLIYGKPRAWVVVCVAVILLPIAILFNSSQHHDYYLINQAPYIFAIVGLGWNQLFQWPQGKQWPLLAAIALVLSHSLMNLQYLLAPIFNDYWQQLHEPLALKNASDPNDRIYLEGFNERFDMPLYSQRLARPYFRESVEALDPSLLVFKDQVRARALREFKDQWVDTQSPYFKITRVKAIGTRQFDPTRHIGLVSTSFPSPSRAISLGRNTLDLCDENTDFVRITVPPESDVSVRLNENEFVFSGARYLSLPTRLSAGCHFDVTIHHSNHLNP